MPGQDGLVRSPKESSKTTLMDGSCNDAYGVDPDRLNKINEVGRRTSGSPVLDMTCLTIPPVESLVCCRRTRT